MKLSRVKRGVALGLIALAPVIAVVWYATDYNDIRFTGPTRFDWQVGLGCLWLASMPPGSECGASGGTRWWVTTIPIAGGFACGIPLWMLMAGSLLTASALTLVRPPRAGACWACGYSRRGLATEAPCPECGKRPQDVAPVRGWSASLVGGAVAGQILGALVLAYGAMGGVANGEIGSAAVLAAGAGVEIMLLIWTARYRRRLSNGERFHKLALVLTSWALVPVAGAVALVLVLP